MRDLIEQLRWVLETQGAQGLNWKRIQDREKLAREGDRYATDAKTRYQRWDRTGIHAGRVADANKPAEGGKPAEVIHSGGLKRTVRPQSKKEKALAARAREHAHRAAVKKADG